MDFDEYDYLEKAVENHDPENAKGTANGSDGTVRSKEKDNSRSSKHRRDEKDDNYGDDGSRSRRLKDNSHDHDRQKQRGSLRHRSGSREGERDRNRSSWEHRDRDKEERNGRERNRDWDRGRDRGERDRDNEKGRDKERERERSHRSSSRSERPQSDPDEKDKEKSRDTELRERERERETRERDRESRRYKEKKEEAAEAEVDPERDQRTVFAYQICLKATEKDVYDFFSRAGKVRDVRLIMDRNSRRSKGVGYIEFYDVMSVPMAIALSGQPLRGVPVMVKPSEAEKNLVQSTTSIAAGLGGQIGPYSGGARRLYVGNLHFNISEDQLRQVFEPFGSVELVQLPLDESGHCKGYGFVQYARLEDARNALNLNGQVEIASRVIKVSAVTDQAGMLEIGGNAGDFDDEEGGGLSLNARSRALLMQKLDRSGTAPSGSLGTSVVSPTGLTLPTAPILGAAPVVPPLVAPLLPGSFPPLNGIPGAGLQLPAAPIPIIDTIGIPSECLLLKNMFDPTLETEPDFDLDIKEDVKEECSKFGNLKHIYVDKNSAGFVYLRFENTQAAMNGQRALHGRWFAGKMITATYMVPQNYETKFPDSK
ncbi:RRM_1 domain-containing protein/RRM_5 domain-containing protein [Cephalotus follicularis]|uniref:RRM_1 domain-containing protein/RRM_5 domain-containing protein n=1 Tax=Cephalotus follicularis TaxID=3775 RepID=A0A1Q3CAG6_CEPFO|nr:RRM_1 domain-containing protein/RRM_5 domain-containing protein [Cephalotus follicularis]